MKFYIFECSTTKGLFAVTGDRAGAKLPIDQCSGSWIFFKEIEDTGGPRIGLDETAAKQQIEKRGFYLTKIADQFTESVVSNARKTR